MPPPLGTRPLTILHWAMLQSYNSVRRNVIRPTTLHPRFCLLCLCQVEAESSQKKLLWISFWPTFELHPSSPAVKKMLSGWKWNPGIPVDTTEILTTL